MNEYSFEQINDKEFERLSVDLLTIHFKTLIQRYKEGKDGGIDGKFYSDKKETVIIQVKHYYKSGFSQLLSKLKNEEKVKLEKIKPERYILVTSVPLSPDNKKKIKDSLKPYIINDSDIFGNAEINDLLSANPIIEKKYFKLWISSTNVLETIFNNAIVGRSRAKLSNIIDSANNYVETSNHREAIKILDKIHTVIISGEPGIGKTSLADALIRNYVSEGFEFFFIEHSISEAEQILDDAEIYNKNGTNKVETKKQIFYFDDFLGRNYLEALELHQDSHIVNFIYRIKKDDNKRFILTSRSNILENGMALSDLFIEKNIGENEYKITISSLDSFDKAQILYNHIWYSQLDEDYIKEIYKDEFFLEIIKHKNFNPRLISFITDKYKIKEQEASEYKNYIEKSLKNPKDVWGNVFDVQLNDVSKDLVSCIVLHGQTIAEEGLKEIFNSLCEQNNYVKKSTFNSVVKQLAGSLLDRSVYDDTIEYDLFNPSIGDFVISEYFNDFHYLKLLTNCVKTLTSINNILHMYSDRSISKEVTLKIIDYQFKKIVLGDKDKVNYYELKVIVSALEFKNKNLNDQDKTFLIKITNRILQLSYLRFIDTCEFLIIAIKKKLISPKDTKIYDFISNNIESEFTFIDESLTLSRLIDLIQINQKHLLEKHKSIALELVADEIDEMIIYVFDDVFDESEFDEDYANYQISETLSNYGIEHDESDIQDFIDSISLDNIIENNREFRKSLKNNDNNHHETKEIKNEGSLQEIKELFERN